jgi:hypothetical protein
MKHKKSDVTVQTMIFLALGIIVLLIMGIFIYQKIKQSSGETEDLLFSSRDSDEDGIPDFQDKCDCVPGKDEHDGCLTSPPPSANMDKNDCKADTT